MMISVSERRAYHVFALACFFLCSSTLLYAYPFYDSTANLSNSWINQPSILANNTDLNPLTPVLMREKNDGSGLAFVCGFYCHSNGNLTNAKDCIFGILMTKDVYGSFLEHSIDSPQLVWSANRNNPVQMNATLQLSKDGDLILANSDGTLVWSSDTRGKSVTGMYLTEEGNLVLFDRYEEPIWESFHYPTDSLLLQQILEPGQRLTSSVSASDWSEGLYYLSIYQDPISDVLMMSSYIKSDPPQSYYFRDNQYFLFDFAWQSAIDQSAADHFLKLTPDGHLKVIQWGGNDGAEISDILKTNSTGCGYPMVCGRYGVCSEGQCSCQENFFREMNPRQPNLGCSPVTPISCGHSQDHTLLELKNTYYFAFQSYTNETILEDCKNRCLSNCSCKAALFATRSVSPSGNGSCLLVNEVFSIFNNENNVASIYNTTLYVKVQHPYSNASSSRVHPRALRRKNVIVASSLATIFGVLSVIVLCLVLFRIRNRQWNETEEDFLSQVPGMPTRYSYENLKTATEDFSKKLGEGGFGSVYEGALKDGTKIAVKCLDGLGKVKDSFLVEVQAIGNIHHVNLVKLIGFCFEKSHRLLVYEYMANRSLDGWIFPGKENKHCFPWQSRRKIISDVAKGLAYLHEDCSQKIIHLDIKPQNILLDLNLNAKISDFGLSKLIEKDQSRVVTRMRGTPGYLAPEWLSSVITEKVDVYSFGVVMLEIICGRKNLDWSMAEEDKHLLRLFKRKEEEERLEELVDGRSDQDMVNHIEEAVEMMKIAAWCLQGDFTRRPSMSIIVKVLEGLVEAETNLDYDFLNPTTATQSAVGDPYDATELLPSALSGPR